jgi:hypothetical protein
MTPRRFPLIGIAAILSSLSLASPSSGEAPAVLGVEELMQNVKRHRGTIRVEGVVSAVASDRQALTLIDTRELRECGVTTCARFKLPVRWTGAMPRVGEIVQVDGEVQEQDGKRLFIARKLEAVSSPAGGP